MREIRVKIIGSAPYDAVRDTCRAVKEGDLDAIKTAARQIAYALPIRAMLIPIPSHKGTTEINYRFATAILNATRENGRDALIADCLEGTARESLYDLKHKGMDPKGCDLGIRWKKTYKDQDFRFLQALNYIPVFVDNVVDTGATITAAVKAVQRNLRPWEDEILVATIGETGNARELERIPLNEREVD